MTDTIGARFRAAREGRGLTQQGLADILDITPAAISQWEQGQTTPDGGRLVRISNILGVSLDWIFKGEGQPLSTPSHVPMDARIRRLELWAWGNTVPDRLPALEYFTGER